MKLTAAAIILLLHSRAICSSTPEGAFLAERVHPRDVIKRAGRNCGTFTMFCDNAAGACNNACYHINCAPNGGATRTMVYDATNSNDRNRMQSGCQSSNSRSVCNSLPFSQAFHDPQNNSPGDMTINCDEWPMATIKQNDFVPGTVRNSLRCINANENSSGEAQLSTFLAGTNTRGAKKTCAGTVQDGDFWQIAFDLTNADQGAVQHCANPSACGGDSYQFHMTVKNGPLDFPYNPSAMNHYTLDGTGKDILQCSVAVHRQGDRAFNVYVYDNSGTQKGMGALSAFANGGTITVTGLPQGLKFTRVGLFAASGAGMSFTYMSTPAFSWFGDTKGSSTTFLADGSYCSVTNTGTAVQDLKCYFPCPAA